MNRMTHRKESANVSIVDMQPHERMAVRKLLAESMSPNPINQAVFRSDYKTAILRQQKMFQHVTDSKHNRLRVARIDDELAGVMCYCSSEHCQLSALQIIRALPSLLWTMESDVMRLMQWQKNWSGNDYPFPHVHLGPIAVHPNHQGRGVGSALLSEFCQTLDQDLALGYLETDKQENVVLYERFGFRVIKVDEVLGVTTWFMVRQRLTAL